MKPTLAAMSYMMNETNRCSVQGQFPGQLTEFQKELNACAKDKSVSTSLSLIFEKAMQENQAFGLGRLHGLNQNGKAYGEFDGFESELGMGSRIGMGIGGVSGGVGNKNLRCLSNSASCSSSSQCCSGNCHRSDMFSYTCTPLRSSGTNGLSNQEGAYVEQGNRDLSSSSSCIESRWDQLGRCDRDSDCCSKKCNIFRDSAYHCEPSTQNGVSGTQETGNLGCLGREYLCIASTQCCPGLKCRQIAPMLPFSRCQP